MVSTQVRIIGLSFLISGAAFAASPSINDCMELDSGLKPEQVEQRPYLDYARECIELIMEYGTDRYGKVHSPILMNILDVRDRTCPENPLPLDEEYRVTRRGRRGPAGANLYADQPTIRAMYALSQVTGDRKYSDFARKSLDYYLSRLVDGKGLLWWGWHRHYDAYRDMMTGHLGDPHEIHFQEAIWPVLWEVNSQVVKREIEAIWQWHVIDKTTGEVNRHDDGKRGCDFAFTAGELAYAFAFMYTKTNEKVWLDRAKLLADYYWQRRDPRTNLVASRPNAGAERFDGSHSDTSVVGAYCYSLLRIHDLTKDPLFRDQAVTYLKAYDRHGWDAEAKQFWGSLRVDGAPARLTGEVADDYTKYQPRGYADLWQPEAASYACPLHAAQAYAYAYALTRDESLLATARKWADCIRAAWPPRQCQTQAFYRPYSEKWAPHGTYAEYYGRTISFLLHMHALTGEREYLALAKTAADEAVSKLYYRGLLRGHPCKPYYEAIDGVGYLLFALVQLDQVTKGADLTKIGFQNR